ncbi:MAG TPA: ABC transporter substrate-binding protein [Xanthobacteraceae bacterium]|jgi:putative ABC transport system substrate-binding protein|nr:ABC transporter substrate-binding protein [Xanthobacteraceae bacterium]
MRRRDFLSFVASAAALRPLAARAQPALPVIGCLSGTHLNPMELERLTNGLAAAGYKDGDNVRIEYLTAEGHYDRLASLAADLVHRNVAIIVTIGGTAPLTAAKAATSTIPIIFAMGADPVKLGLVESLNRPGGNITGVTFLVDSLGAKRVDLLHALLPAANPVGFLVNAENPSHDSETHEVETAIKAFGFDTVVQGVTKEADIDAAFQSFAQHHAGAVSVAADAYLTSRRGQIVALAAQYGLPTIYPREEYAADGGLMSYAPRPADAFRTAGLYAARILKGEKPADLPVQQADKVFLTINLKTAKTLGLSIPPTLLALADAVIE